MDKLAKKIIVKDGNGNIKNIQYYDHNDKNDPIYFKKIINEKVVTELVYIYKYDALGRKLEMKIKDKILNTITVMEYEY